MIESLAAGVPVLVMPLMLDQISNAFLAEKKGYGLSMDFCHFTEQLFREKTNELLTNYK